MFEFDRNWCSLTVPAPAWPVRERCYIHLEVILARIWVWLTFAEVPAPLSLTGAAVVLSALVLHSALSLRCSKPPVGMA